MTRPTASRPKQRWALALTALVTAAAAPSYAQTPQKSPPRVDDKNAPTTVQAEEIGGRPEREITLEREAEVVRGKTRVTADTACYKEVEDEVDASGHVHMWRFGDQYTGDLLNLNLESGKGFLLHPTYKMEISNGQGKAQRIDFINEDEMVVIDGTYSTCEGLDPDWYLKSSTLNLDTGRDVGTGAKTIVYFKGVPIVGTPAISFSLSGARRSGWLSPTPGAGPDGKPQLMVPYYFNIAPNRDLTLSPNIIPARGLQIGALGRYLGETEAGTYSGQTDLVFLPHDKETDSERYMLNSQHAQALAPGLSFGWNVRADSDNNYPNDFSTTVAASADRQLMRELSIDYRSPFWTLSARAEAYQVLQDPAALLNPALTLAQPYGRLPELNFHSGRFDVAGGFDWAMDVEATRFTNPDPTLVDGSRLVVSPQISYPILGPGYFITPKVMLTASAYQLDASQAQSTQFPNRSPAAAVPTFSLDSGLVFERDEKPFGHALTQTLEPRLFYVYTPYRDQSQFPIFDTAAATFNQTQLFSENRFVGTDRIGDANQLTAALTSRFLEASGAERLRFTIGQRISFTEQQVQLPSLTPVNSTRSDLLVTATGRISDTWTFDSAEEYSPSSHATVSSNYTVQWKPAPKKVLNLAFLYLQDNFKNVQVSSQWPLSQRWYGVGLITYSTLDKRVIESLIGLEYRADCWVLRMGAQRFISSVNTVSNPMFFQLELNGLSKLGVGNPLDAFKREIPGYQNINPVIIR